MNQKGPTPGNGDIEGLRVQMFKIEAHSVKNRETINSLIQAVRELETSEAETRRYIARLVQELDAKKERERVAVIQEVASTDKSYRLITAAISILTVLVIVLTIVIAVYLRR